VEKAFYHTAPTKLLGENNKIFSLIAFEFKFIEQNFDGLNKFIIFH